MIIRSNFHDYYDVVAKQGVERSIVYERYTEILSEQLGRYQRHVSPPNVRHFAIQFCGKQYPGIKVNFGTGKPICFYGLESFDNFLRSHLRIRDFAYYEGRKKHSDLLRYRCDTTWFGVRKTHQDFLRREDMECKLNLKRYQALAPVLAYDSEDYSYTADPCLADYEFYKVVDTYTAYQTLMQYIGSIAQPEKVIPHVSDADMLEAKGFNMYSFRKDGH